MKYLYLITGFKVCSALAVAVAGGIESRTTPSTKCDLKNFLDNVSHVCISSLSSFNISSGTIKSFSLDLTLFVAFI